MKIHTYEKAFLAAGIVVLVACGAALVYATLGMGIHLPGDAGQVDPRALSTTPPFDQPGVRQTATGQFEAVVIARAWSFSPAEVRVPVGAEVTFTVTSGDVLHGFNVEGTRLNLMAIPGQVARNSYRFRRPGQYLIICHEYCGLGHHTMYGRVIVEPAGAAPVGAGAGGGAPLDVAAGAGAAPAAPTSATGGAVGHPSGARTH